jgi:hypothetical protein
MGHGGQGKCEVRSAERGVGGRVTSDRWGGGGGKRSTLTFKGGQCSMINLQQGIPFGI